MSLIFGIFNRNGKPVNRQDIETMYQSVSHFPHNSYDLKIDNNIAFGHILNYNTPESIYEQMPKYLPEQELFFVSESRLDNRKEIANQLNIKLDDNIPDGELILKAYLRWGQETPEKLIGKWSFAAFHIDKQELFIAQDHHGYTSIDYYLKDDVIIFSSSIKSILALNQVNKKLNEKTLVSALVLLGGEIEQGLYKDITKLQPAHKLTVTKSYSEKKRYWFPENIETNYKKNLNDYSYEFKEILNIAVKDNLRSYKPVASMLSGGLDSGTVAFLAAEFFKLQGKKLTTYSHIPFYEPVKITGRYGNEKPYIMATSDASGNINSIFLDSKNTSPIDSIFRMIDITNSVVYGAVNSNWLIDITEQSFIDGFGTLLTGEHGNANISFSGVDYILPWEQFYKFRGLKKTIKQKLLKPFILNNFANIYKKLKYSKNIWETYSYINPNFAEKLKLQELFKEKGSLFKLSYNSSKDNMLAILMPGMNPRCYAGADLSNYFGIEWRDPTADKRVIEYALTIPNKVFFNENGENKNIIKMMMKNQLPDKVLYSRDKGMQGADIGLRLMAEKDKFEELINDLVKSSLVSETIDLKKIKNEWSQIKSITDNNYDVGKINNILRTIMIACFLQRFN